MRAWDAEILVDEELARRLIGSQFPEVELRSLHHLAEGWDNTVFVACADSTTPTELETELRSLT